MIREPEKRHLFHLSTVTMVLCLPMAVKSATLVGPLPYLSAADVPSGFYLGDSPIALEDFEDGTLDFGLISDGTIVGPSSHTDSVDADDGQIDGLGRDGWSMHSTGTSSSITIEYPGAPTAVGLVYTDNPSQTVSDATTLEAFDASGNSLGVFGPFPLGDAFTNGTTAEDRFFGPADDGGISKVTIASVLKIGIELDHIQYGAMLNPDVLISPKSTYLQPENPAEVRNEVEPPVVLDLVNDLLYPVTPGDYLRVQAVGKFDFDESGQDDGGPYADGSLRNAWGVFSSSDELGPKSEPNRVPDQEPLVADSMTRFLHVPPISSGFVPDLPHDFIIPTASAGGEAGIAVVRVPDGATHLFLGAADEIWFDNIAEDNFYGVRITRVAVDGDFDNNDLVDAADAAILFESWGDIPLGDPIADINGDGVVDAADASVVFSNWTGDSDRVVPVPEPAMGLPVCCFLFIAKWRRRV